MKRVFFLNFVCEEGKITCSRLVLRFPSNSLCHRVVLAKKLSVAMASRFEIVHEEYWKNVFKNWANETQI